MLMHSIITRSFHGPKDAFSEQLQHQQGHIMLEFAPFTSFTVMETPESPENDFLVCSPDLGAVPVVGSDIQEHRVARDFYRSRVVYGSVVTADVLSFHHHRRCGQQ